MFKTEVAVSTSNNVEINELLGMIGSAPDSEATSKALFPGAQQFSYTNALLDDSRFTTLFKQLVHGLMQERGFDRHFVDYSESKIAVPIKSGVQLIPKKQIIYLEATGNYTKVYRSEKKTLLVSKTLKVFEPALQEAFFVRVHRKYIVNIFEIVAFLKSNGGELQMSNDVCLSVSKKQQEAIQLKLQQISSFI